MVKIYASIVTLFFLSISTSNIDISRQYDRISMSQISSMKIHVTSIDGNTRIVNYTKKNNYMDILMFVRLFNLAKPYIDDRDTTHLTYICINLEDGNKIEVWGGSEEFQEVKEGGNQYIFKSISLSVYFKYLSLRYKP